MIDMMVPTTTTTTKKRSLRVLLGAATLAFFASCQSSDPAYNHWNFTGLGPRVAYHMLSYDTEGGKPYYQHVAEQRSDINMTLRRHLLNDNPENPFQRSKPYIPSEPHFGILPNPVNFLSFSSLAFGAALLGSGGGFILFPYEIVPVLFEEGGASEIFASWSPSGKGPQPAPVSEFEVRNK